MKTFAQSRYVCIFTPAIKRNTRKSGIMETNKLNKEYKKIAKRYFKLEEKEFKNFDEQRELDIIEIRMSEIANILENS